MRLSGMAFWRFTARQIGLAARRLVLALGLIALMPLAWTTSHLAQGEASRPEPGQAASQPPLPFSSEADLLAALGSDFEPIRELFLNIALAQICGLKTKQVEGEYLARRAQLVQREDLDFDTLKALRYLSYISLERTLRAVEPAQLRPWCDAQSATLNTFFQPQL